MLPSSVVALALMALRTMGSLGLGWVLAWLGLGLIWS
jgi:hypothetical protein